jgi:ribosomal protein L27
MKCAVMAVLALANPARGFLAPRSGVAAPFERVSTPSLRKSADAGVETLDQQSSGSGVLASGAVALAALLAMRGAKRSSLVSTNANGDKVAYQGEVPGMMREIPDAFQTKPAKMWWALRKYARKDPQFKQHRWRSNQKMREHFSAYRGEMKYWYPTEQFNLYKGPESLDGTNSYFPAASGGLPMKAVPEQTSSVGRQGTRSLFAGARVPTFGSAKRAVAGSRSAIVMFAHKMAASSTRWQGKNSNNSEMGLRKAARTGSEVRTGQLLVKQYGYKWKKGTNVYDEKYKLYAGKSGVVQWFGKHPGPRRTKEIYVVPFEYVREKCEWKAPGKLGAKKYEPWMGNPEKHPKNIKNGGWDDMTHMERKREEFLLTDEGKEFTQKKEEKKQKQKEIMKKVWGAKKAKRAARVKELIASGDMEARA